jgi:hypothetical protein
MRHKYISVQLQKYHVTAKTTSSSVITNYKPWREKYYRVQSFLARAQPRRRVVISGNGVVW